MQAQKRNSYLFAMVKKGDYKAAQDYAAKAIEHYEKFLKLWKDADPGIVEVEDAKKRLAALGASAPQ